MTYKISYSNRTEKFLNKNNIKSDVIKIIKKFIKKIQGDHQNIDIKKLKGKWKGYYRIRMGDIRIILKYNNKNILIDTIDFRENIY